MRVPWTKSVRFPPMFTAALLLEAISGHDSRDSTSVDSPFQRSVRRLINRFRDFSHRCSRGTFCRGTGSRNRDGRSAQSCRLSSPWAPTERYSSATFKICGCDILPCRDFGSFRANLARYDGVHYGVDPKISATAWLKCMKRAVAKGSERKSNDESCWVFSHFLLATPTSSIRSTSSAPSVREGFRPAFKQVDMIAGPVTPSRLQTG